jgi:hypothetical protein
MVTGTCVDDPAVVSSDISIGRSFVCARFFRPSGRPRSVRADASGASIARASPVNGRVQNVA